MESLNLNDFINQLKNAVHEKGLTTRDVILDAIQQKDNGIFEISLIVRASCEQYYIVIENQET